MKQLDIFPPTSQCNPNLYTYFYYYCYHPESKLYHLFLKLLKTVSQLLPCFLPSCFHSAFLLHPFSTQQRSDLLPSKLDRVTPLLQWFPSEVRITAPSSQQACEIWLLSTSSTVSLPCFSFPGLQVFFLCVASIVTQVSFFFFN